MQAFASLQVWPWHYPLPARVGYQHPVPMLASKVLEGLLLLGLLANLS
uniref:Uncharacterized protein LOC107465964 isoform X2 n=1 Tax=Rhizophora mucronata TaxID=61149 RepID=A0A2P2M3R6_RHIMU